ncbi:hypothetical protein [Sphingobacterium anhuiense]|uniref:cAMP-binding domain of CRP or a regulatory subunit of cAMP-dependent protein kinases n=1 Tax=Sphingobacterium anhuiense TaxID=493780 RepID=A0ABW5YVQ3_9SPHI
MENRESYKMLIKHLEAYRKLKDDQEKLLRQLVTVKYCAEKEIYLERGGIAKHLCFIYTGYALGYERRDEESKLSRIWQSGETILKTDSLLAFQRSKMDIIFPEGGHIIEIPFDYMGHTTALEPFFNYLLWQEVEYYQKQENLFRRHSSKELIDWFHLQYSSVRYKLTDQQIAQFLGITVRWYNKNKNVATRT